MKKVILLGASGSIGIQTIDIIRQHPDLFSLQAISIGKNIPVLREILKEFSFCQVVVSQEEDAKLLSLEYPNIEFLFGESGLCQLARRTDYDLLVNALVGFVGFAPTMAAIETGHDVALANKETLVVGGALINRALHQYGVSLYPIDSEHSAIFQALQGNRKEQVKRLIITASGGSFRNKTRKELEDVTVEQALAHPNWSMGAKITIDSATMMNKGFEVIEAHWLFELPYEKIDVIMHRESVIHSMVEYIDHSIMAQLGAPDMRLPIQYAMSYPERLFYEQSEPFDLAKIATMHFEQPDFERFPLLALAYEVGKKGGNLPAIMNAANEVANEAFRNHKIKFLDIETIVIDAVASAKYVQVDHIDDLLNANAWGRHFAEERVKEQKK